MENAISQNAIAEILNDYKQIEELILPAEPSMAQRLFRNLKKMYILSCGSYYEHRIIDSLKCYAKQQSDKYKHRPHGFDNMSQISFYKLFNFGQSTSSIKEAKEFLDPFKLLGDACKKSIVDDICKSDEMVINMKAFEEICVLRNCLVHNDLAIANDAIESKTFEEASVLNENALKFVGYIELKISE